MFHNKNTTAAATTGSGGGSGGGVVVDMVSGDFEMSCSIDTVCNDDNKVWLGGI